VRILTVSHFFESHGGGIERVAGHLCRQFAALGAEPVWAASDCDAAPSDGVEAVPLSCANPVERLTGLPMPIPGPRAIAALARQIRRSDAVIVHDALYLTSIAALLLGKLFGKRIVLIQHIAGVPFSSRLLRLVMRLANWIVTRPMLWTADERVFISDVVRQELLGQRAARSHLLFNGVDGGIFRPDPATSRTSPLHALPEGRRILFVGRYVEKKGLSVLRSLARSRPDLSFILAGAGPIRPAEWALPNVHDLGPLTAPALAELYRSADLLLLPSVGEGFPLVIQEAMACGLPVLCGTPTDRADPAAARWLRGVPVDLADPAGSAKRCAEAIDGFALPVDDRSAMARYAREHYDWRTMAASLTALAEGKSQAVYA
jgi:alpha-maltose-1-phosphate synthase